MDALSKPLGSLSDEELFELLDAVSDEVKRRNGLIGPPVAPDAPKVVESRLSTLLEAIAKAPKASQG